MDRLVIDEVVDLPNGESAVSYVNDDEPAPAQREDAPYRPLVVFGHYGSRGAHSGAGKTDHLYH